MRIAIATAFRQVIGGAETWLQALVPELVRRGHEVALASEYRAGRHRPEIGDELSDLPAFCAAELGAHGVVDALERWRPEVLFSHGLQDAALEAALVSRFPAVLYAHDYRGTCAVGTKWHTFPRYTACHRRMGAACFPINYLRRCGGLSPVKLVRSYVRQRELAAILPAYRAVLVASQAMREEFLRHDVEAARLHVVPLAPPGLQPDLLPPRVRPVAGRIAFVGRLTRPKGAHVLLDAVARAGRMLECRLVLEVLGEGAERERLEKMAQRARVDVRFGGWLARPARDDLVRSVDLLGVPSLWPEPFGLVGIEAGCLGVPSVGFAHGGVTDWLRPGLSGELAPASPATATGLSQAIVRALRDPEHHARLRRGAWENARTFTMARHLATLEPILETARRG